MSDQRLVIEAKRDERYWIEVSVKHFNPSGPYEDYRVLAEPGFPIRIEPYPSSQLRIDLIHNVVKEMETK